MIETDGLLPRWVTLQRELDELEQANIARAYAWALGRAHADLLSDAFVRQLHLRMFGDVWRRAGQYRDTNIRGEVEKLLDDVDSWIAHQTFAWPEIGARFHHRLVSVRPFSNGNRRHARLMTELLLEAHGQRAFTWGASLGSVQAAYVQALKEADGRRYGPLIDFVQQ